MVAGVHSIYRTADGERIPRVAAYALPGLPQTTVSPQPGQGASSAAPGSRAQRGTISPDAMLRIYPGYRTADGERIPRVAAYALPGLPQTTVSP
ncbi:hypothetical protein [Klebsiella michiganensis]